MWLGTYDFHWAAAGVTECCTTTTTYNMTKKRKLSDLSSQEVDLFLKMIENFKGGLNEAGEDEKSVITSLDHVVAKIRRLVAGNIFSMKHVPFSSATTLTFLKAKIKAGPMALMLNKTPDITRLGLAGNNRLTVDQTKSLISLIRAHVSFSVSIIHSLCSLYLPLPPVGGGMPRIGQYNSVACCIENWWY